MLTPFQKKIKSIGHSKFLPERIEGLKPKLSSEELENLVIRLKHNIKDLNARNQIIESHLRLALSVAARYGAKNKDKISDLIGEALLCLTENVIRFCNPNSNIKTYDNNITPYLTSCIHGRLIDYIENDHQIGISGRTVRYYTAIGSSKLDKLPNKITLIVDAHTNETSDEYEGAGPLDSPYIIPQTTDDHASLEIKEILDKVTTNFIEKRIIKLRSEGYSYKEISPLVGYSAASISTILDSIEQRFNKLYKIG